MQNTAIPYVQIAHHSILNASADGEKMHGQQLASSMKVSKY